MRTIKTPQLDVIQICPEHNCEVPARVGKNGKDYWRCEWDHFLKHPNEYLNDRIPEDIYYDKEDKKKEND